jgi:hypothetical protein
MYILNVSFSAVVSYRNLHVLGERLLNDLTFNIVNLFFILIDVHIWQVMSVPCISYCRISQTFLYFS